MQQQHVDCPVPVLVWKWQGHVVKMSSNEVNRKSIAILINQLQVHVFIN